MKKPLLVFLMGPTNTGKTTLLTKMLARCGDTAGSVEVGKILRAKYGEAYFNGQAAPAHTAREAWDIFIDSVEQYTKDGKEFVFIDGQPRDFQQCADVISLQYDKVYLNLYSSVEVREARMNNRDGADPAKLELSKKRLHGDLPMLYEVLSRLTLGKQQVHMVDTSNEIDATFVDKMYNNLLFCAEYQLTASKRA